MLGLWSSPAKPFSAQPPIVRVATPEYRLVPVFEPTNNGPYPPNNLDACCRNPSKDRGAASCPNINPPTNWTSRLVFPGRLPPLSDAPACTSRPFATCPSSVSLQLPLPLLPSPWPDLKFVQAQDLWPPLPIGKFALRVASTAAAECILLPAVSGEQLDHHHHNNQDLVLRSRSSGGRVQNSVPTDPHAFTNPPIPTPASVVIDDSRNPRIYSPSVQPAYPGLASPTTEQHVDQQQQQQPLAVDSPAALVAETVAPAVPRLPPPPPLPLADNSQRVGRPTKSSQKKPHHHQQPQASSSSKNQQGQQRLHSPFRNRAASASPHRPRRPGAARLWNPTNSTPRAPKTSKTIRKRRPSTPPLPSVPLSHPVIRTETDADKPPGTGSGDTPLLSLTEQRQTKHPAQSRPSLQIEHCGASEKRISLPRAVRHSYDEKRSANPTPTPTNSDPSDWPFPAAIQEQTDSSASKKLDKGKDKEIIMAIPDVTITDDRGSRSFSKDLERGPDVLDPRLSGISVPDGIGSPVSSSNSSIMGEDVGRDATQEWGPQHPCFPHLNPYVPVGSPEYTSTRIIRVRRDFLVAGDLAPTFSNTYPDILDPVGFSEQEFRRVIQKLNSDLIRIHNPYSWRNVLDATMGLITGWIWDDLGLTGAKAQLNALEKWIERWNLEMEKTLGSDEGLFPPKIIPLRKTAYMTLDIQIPDPEIAAVPATPSEHGGFSDNNAVEAVS
ncbi:hypothetical protein jhhlp_001211 [Lomentospora prolificans]|uniref:Ras modification protein ERF4 n=1 Tax=Lomentospora prolificans TaxID=41688 RepID=A0A2N3NHH5_9PEZI|nr:hypothetical protein jhhlp_001211 [Lomentospora prolificans]